MLRLASLWTFCTCKSIGLQTIGTQLQFSTRKHGGLGWAGLGWDMVQCSNNGQGWREGHPDPQPLRRDETSRGQGIGENLGVKGVREIGIKFRIFSLSRSYRKLPRFFSLLFCSLFARRPDTLHRKWLFILVGSKVELTFQYMYPTFQINNFMEHRHS